MRCKVHPHFCHVHLVHVLLLEAHCRIIKDVEIHIIFFNFGLTSSWLQVSNEIGVKHVEDCLVVFLLVACVLTVPKELVRKILEHVIEELSSDSLLKFKVVFC